MFVSKLILPVQKNTIWKILTGISCRSESRWQRQRCCFFLDLSTFWQGHPQDKAHTRVTRITISAISSDRLKFSGRQPPA